MFSNTHGMAGMAAPAPLININIGVVGHVDSGKTSLVRALSTLVSTAALDKNPQSQARGITLDLGFSSFAVPCPPRLATGAAAACEQLQFTLVDCPGHASLIRTIIGGAQIIDMMLLVVDVVKGVQTQTAECLVVGEICTERLVVVLNKTDLLPEATRAAAVDRATARVRKALAGTRFAAAPVLALAAAPGGAGKLGAGSPEAPVGAGGNASVAALVQHLVDTVELPQRAPGGPFLFAIDHCFQIKGQGTVLTGTVLSGSLAVNDTLELPALRQEKKVKSMQMFRRPVQCIRQGDRAGVCVTGLDPGLIERGLACTPGSIPTIATAIALVRRVRYYRNPMDSCVKLHISIGHATVMAEVVFFGAAEIAAAAAAAAAGGGGAGAAAAAPSPGMPPAFIPPFTPGSAWEWQEAMVGGRKAREVVGGEGGSGSAAGAAGAAAAPAPAAAGGGSEGGNSGAAAPSAPSAACEWQYAVLRFESPVQAPLGALVIGSRLDGDVHGDTCRLAFHGRLVCELPRAAAFAAPAAAAAAAAAPSASACSEEHYLKALRLYKRKLKCGVVDRVEGSDGAGVAVIGRGLFKKEVDMNQFAGLRVAHAASGWVGSLEGAFGKAGKFKAFFRASGSEGGSPRAIKPGDALTLRYKKYLYGAESLGRARLEQGE